MRRLHLNAVCLWTACLVPGIGPASVVAAERLTGTENPDPSHIKGAGGDATIVLTPRNDIEDHRNLQWALDNATPGGTVRLGAGTFFMGDGKSAPRKTAWMRRGLKVAAVSLTDVPSKYGVSWVPSLFLIGPDGKLIANSSRAFEIREATKNALAKK